MAGMYMCVQVEKCMHVTFAMEIENGIQVSSKKLSCSSPALQSPICK